LNESINPVIPVISQMKTGVVIHGCNLHIENWLHVAWGDPPNRPGRIPQGILVAHRFDAAVIVMGTGASSEPFHFGDDPDDDEVPLPEAEYSLRYLTDYFDDLAGFRPLQQSLGTADSESFIAARRSLLERIQLDLKSQNTIEEIHNASEIFLDHEVEQVVLVSSPSHIVRCLRDAAALYASHSRFARYRCNLLACPSVTCYEGSTPADVVVIEPPHRPDRHVLPTHRRIQRMLELQRTSGEGLVALIEDFDQLLQRYEHRVNHGLRKP
jgi:hypothetical protein